MANPALQWQLRVLETSGYQRTLNLTQSQTIGRGETATVQIKDPSLPEAAALIWKADETPDHSRSSYWIRDLSEGRSAIQIGDLHVREACIPLGVAFKVGETRFQLEPHQPKLLIPDSPIGAKPWLTCSEQGRQLLWQAKKVSLTPLSIFLAGETGTGKEVFAHLIHCWSPRRSGPFVPLHCAALPLSLAESELFGHMKGAFTGAIQNRPGALLQAHGGTLFLDEIGDLPMDIQVKLLRFLENGEIRPVGSDRTSRADVRLICATHKPLKRLVEEGKFRQDLYYRLASVTLDIPSLRSRPEDIELLARKFADNLGYTLSPQAVLRLKAHTWPGNVRELQHAIERAVGLAGTLTRQLPEEAFEFLLTPENISAEPQIELGASVLSLAEMERVVLLKALRLSNGNRARAAKILGVARSTLFEMLKRHKVTGPRTRSSFLEGHWGQRAHAAYST